MALSQMHVSAAELRHMLISLPAMNYYPNSDGTASGNEEDVDSPGTAAQLELTVQQLLEDHDNDGGA